MTTWIDRAVFYHIYPLGLLDTPALQADAPELAHRLRDLHAWIAQMASLGCNALYLGPVFSSVSHGYDTRDYRVVDRRLGDNQDLIQFVQACREVGIRVVFDGVFNHVGREFFAFQDLQQNGETSHYLDWFVDVDFSQGSPLGDPFSYYAYEGNFDLVKLNLANADVRSYLFETVDLWFETFGASGIRFDAVDVLNPGFVQAICAHCRAVSPDSWLLGEVVFDDYTRWLASGMLDSVTNYEAYKGLWSSLNDRNLFEIAWSLNRQFGPEGIYRERRLYSFADNHDVDRIASRLKSPATDLALLYAMLYTMPGVPSIYYGSEWGIGGSKSGADDRGMRAAVDIATAANRSPFPWLLGYLAELAAIRQSNDAIRHGDYRQLHVAAAQFAYQRTAGDSVAIVVVNASATDTTMELEPDLPDGAMFTDALDPEVSVSVERGRLAVSTGGNSIRILISA